MSTRRAILAFLKHRGSSATSLEIADHLRSLGFWFVEARCWPALRAMERDGILRRHIPVVGRNRGFRDVHSFYVVRG